MRVRSFPYYIQYQLKKKSCVETTPMQMEQYRSRRDENRTLSLLLYIRPGFLSRTITSVAPKKRGEGIPVGYITKKADRGNAEKMPTKAPQSCTFLKSLSLLSPDTRRDPTVRPGAGRQFEIRIRTQQHISLLLSLFSPPRHAQIGLPASLAASSFRSGPPVRIYPSLADGCHVTVIARRTHLAVLQLLV